MYSDSIHLPRSIFLLLFTDCIFIRFIYKKNFLQVTATKMVRYAPMELAWTLYVIAMMDLEVVTVKFQVRYNYVYSKLKICLFMNLKDL